MNATATHDTKRGEDTRLRINVLSEFADEWIAALDRWADWRRRLPGASGGQAGPGPAEEVLLYQSMLGVWPPDDDEPPPPMAERLADYMTKAAREAKLATSWLDPQPGYEAGLRQFVQGLVAGEGGRRVRADMAELRRKTAFFGCLYSLAQTVLKITAPGVPDFYQGTELWDLALVDPDNRRPVGFEAREAALAALRSPGGGRPEQLLAGWRDGRVKLFTTTRSLALRAAHAATFERGDYLPLAVSGRHAGRACAFARRDNRDWIVVAVPRLAGGLVPAGQWPLGQIGGAPALELGGGAPRRYVEWFTGGSVEVGSGSADLRLGEVFRGFPVALLVAR